MNRADVVTFIQQHVKTDVLMRHLIAVEAAMKAYAKKYGEDEEKWGIAGLVHDFDWEIVPTPEEHPAYGANILQKAGFSDEIVRAVLTHGNHTEIELKRESLMEKVLFAVDELTGFIRAVALVGADKNLKAVNSKRVRKKMKDKAFARQVNRDDIVNGAEAMDLDLDTHIDFVVNSLAPVATDIGLVQHEISDE